MAVLATTHSHRSLVWGIVLVAIGVLHLAFRQFYARRSAAIETARQETAPRVAKGRWFYLTGQHANMTWIVASSAIMVVVGLALIATHA